MRFFIAGIMQGSHQDDSLHCQQYRQRIISQLNEHFPNAEIYDPFADHQNSIDYDHEVGRQVFMDHNQMCCEVEVVVAFVPEASMGTAIEMWQAHRHGRFVVAVSPLLENWSIKFLSQVIYPDETLLEQAIVSGELAQLIDEFYDNH